MKTALEPFMIYYGMDLFKKAPANRNNIIEYQLPCNFVQYRQELSYPPSLSYNSNITHFSIECL